MMCGSMREASGPRVADAAIGDVATIDAHRIHLELLHGAFVGGVVAEQGELLHAAEEPALLELALRDRIAAGVGRRAGRVADGGGGAAAARERVLHLPAFAG